MVRRLIRRAYWWVWGQAIASEDEQRAALMRIMPSARIHPTVFAEHLDVYVPELDGCALSVGAQTQAHISVPFSRSKACVSIGARSQFNGGFVDVAERITIGDDVLIAADVVLMDHDSHSPHWRDRRCDGTRPSGAACRTGDGPRDWTGVRIAPIRIGDKAWIGRDVIILRGVDIGEGAIIGAGSVVTKSVPPWTVAAGNPARVIRTLADDDRA